MNPSIISALAALTGAAIGGLSSLCASWIAQKYQARSQWVSQEARARNQLYNAFIEDASRCFVDALQHSQGDIAKLVALYANMSRMRIVSSSEVMASAERVGQTILDTYLKPDRTLIELRDIVRHNSRSIDVLRDFSEKCKSEFEALRKL